MVAESAYERVGYEDSRILSGMDVSVSLRENWCILGDAQLDVDTATDKKT